MRAFSPYLLHSLPVIPKAFCQPPDEKANTAMDKDTKAIFPLARLPFEIQGMIWQYTWQPRGIIILRTPIQQDEMSDPIQVSVNHPFAVLEDWINHHSPDETSAYSTKQLFARCDCCDFPLPDRAVHEKAVATITSTDTKPPVSLFVDSVARYHTLRHYRLAFALPGGESHVYFNFAIDTLFVPTDTPIWGVISLAELANLRFLAIQSFRLPHRAHTSLSICTAKWGTGNWDPAKCEDMEGWVITRNMPALDMEVPRVMDILCPKLERLDLVPCLCGAVSWINRGFQGEPMLHESAFCPAYPVRRGEYALYECDPSMGTMYRCQRLVKFANNRVGKITASRHKTKDLNFHRLNDLKRALMEYQVPDLVRKIWGMKIGECLDHSELMRHELPEPCRSSFMYD